MKNDAESDVVVPQPGHQSDDAAISLELRQLPPTRRHILSQRVSLIRRPDPEVPVVRRTPLVNDRQDLDELVPAGEARRRLVAPSARVAVDGNRECIAHPPSVRARFLVRQAAVAGEPGYRTRCNPMSAS